VVKLAQGENPNKALFMLFRKIQNMKTLLTKGLTLSLATIFMASSAGLLHAEAEKKEPREGAVVYKVTDVAVVRPLAAGATLLGGALFLITWPFTAASGDSDETYAVLVRKPAKIAFDRKEGRNETLPKGTKALKTPRSQ
jgi:hypothetical protein